MSELPTGDFSRKRFHTMLALALMVSGVYCFLIMRQGWTPDDEGVLAQSAERTLHGEFPHLDFDEPYSGGLTWLHSLAFRIWGVRLLSMRIPLVGFYLLFVAALYALATRWLTPTYAALLSLASLGWGLPATFVALPSWYLTFFAGYGTYFLMRYLESGRKSWLFAAGFMGGLSTCFKILGIYFVMAGALFLSYRETACFENQKDKTERGGHPLWLIAYKLLIVLVIIAGLTAVLWRRLGLKEFVHFLLPAALLSAVTIVSDIRAWRGEASSRLKRLGYLEIAFLAGTVTPILLYALVFWRFHALHALFEGLFVLPQRRYDYAFYPLPPHWTIIAGIPAALFFWRSALRQPASPRWLQGGLLTVLLFCALGGFEPRIYRTVWYSLRPLVPFMVSVGGFWLIHPKLAARVPWLQRQRLFLALIMMAFVSLVQFPDSYGGYFFYTAAFVVLAGVALFKTTAQRFHDEGTLVILAYAVFGFLWLARAEVVTAGVRYIPRSYSENLNLTRGGLQVGKSDHWVYETLVGEIQKHSIGSDYIYAGPDCPEVYFLSGKRNPTRVFYEFFAPEHATTEVILKAIHDRDIKVVVLNASPGFSPRVSKELYQGVARHFPHYEDIRNFRLFW